MALAFQFEKKVALAAVTRACALTQQVFHNLVAAQSQTLTKDDKSPVTVADFSAQAVINTVLRSAFPNDPIIGEEDSADLRSSNSTATISLRSRLESLANDALRAPLTNDKEEDPAWGIGPTAPIRSIDTLLTAIDQGNYKGGPTGRQWTLDPIDGTKGFLRGEQYAVCLALIVDSVVQVSVTGCPNLPVSSSNPDGERGCLFVAVKGQGAEQRLLSNPWGPHTPLKLQPTTLSKLALLESREGAHSSHDLSAKISQRIGLTAPPVRMDSQAKYCALARGDGGIFLRLPIPGKGYVEKIWDHAAGALLVTEAGAAISDTRGEPLNFGLGRTLGENHGIIAAFKDIHPQIIQSIAALRAEEQQQQNPSL